MASYGGLSSLAITDATAAGRAVLTAADEAAQVSALDIDDIRNYSIVRAKALAGITNPLAWEDPFMSEPGTASSFWSSIGLAVIANVTTLPGGWKQMSSTGLTGSVVAMYNTNRGAVVANVGTKPFYMAWLFKLDTTPDAQSRLEIGFIDTALSADQPCFGVNGAVGTTKFRFTDRTAGVDSAINIDTGVHLAEFYGLGDGVMRGMIDAETPVTYTTAKTAAMMPFVQIGNGTTLAAQSLSVGHCVYVTGRI